MKLAHTIVVDYKKLVNKNRFNLLHFFENVLLKANFRAVFLFRMAGYFDKKRIFFIAYILEKLMHITTITWISRRAQIEEGFVIRHIGGIVVGGRCVIGKNCEIRQGVTMGGNLGKEKYDTTQPILGDNILVGAGAKILGPVKIGDNCIIGANTVVINDIPENSVVGGVPGKVLRKIRPNENPLID